MSIIYDADGKSVTHAGDPNYVERSHHNKMLGEVADALSQLFSMTQAVVSARDAMAELQKIGVIAKDDKAVNDYLLKTGIIVKKAEKFLGKYAEGKKK